MKKKLEFDKETKDASINVRITDSMDNKIEYLKNQYEVTKSAVVYELIKRGLEATEE